MRLWPSVRKHRPLPRRLGETDIDQFLVDRGYLTIEDNGHGTTHSDGPEIERRRGELGWIELLFTEYERRTSVPLSVIYGRTGSMGTTTVPRLVLAVGNDRTPDEREQIIDLMLTETFKDGSWTDGCNAVIRRWGTPVLAD